MQKGLAIEDISRKIKLIKNENIKVGAFFMLGYPGETDFDRELTLQLSLQLPLDYAKFTIFIPQPGTEIFKKLNCEKKLFPLDSLLCADNEFSNNFTNLPPDQLKSLQRKFSLRFYAIPNILFNILKEYCSLTRLPYLLKLFYLFIFSQRSTL